MFCISICLRWNGNSGQTHSALGVVDYIINNIANNMYYVVGVGVYITSNDKVFVFCI